MKELSAIVLVGGRGSRLQGLTKTKSKSYVSFMGKYRIIDFPLSSLSNSGVEEVGLITQYEPYELMRYIGSGSSWDLDYVNAGISFLTPYEAKGSLIYQKGTANAVLSQIGFIKQIQSKYILILSGDQIYKIDFREILEEHKKNGAELTIISKDITDEAEDLTRFGIIEYDKYNKVLGFEEKPKKPKSNRISLGMYLFNKDFLLKYLEYADKLVDFGSDLIPFLIKETDRVYSYNYTGRFMDVGTVESLYYGNMFYLEHPEILDNKGQKYKIYSHAYDYPPQALGPKAKVSYSVLTDGCMINGTIIHSVMSYGTVVLDNAEVIDSVILPNTKIGKESKIKNAIIDEGLSIPDNTNLIFDKPTLVDEDYLGGLNVQ